MSHTPQRRQVFSWIWEKPYAFIAMCLLVVAFGFFPIRYQNYFGDEGFHIDQIRIFLNGEFRMSGPITMLPGFHLLSAAAGFVFHRDSLQFYRFVNLLVSLFSVPAFYLASRAVDPKATIAKLPQYVFFPILFPFFFLLYTDVLSMVLSITSIAAVTKRRYALGGALGILSMTVRQNNVIWFGFAILLFLVQECEPQLWALWNAVRQWSIRSMGKSVLHLPWKMLLRRGWVFALGLMLFALFLSINGGMAIGDEGAHPFPAIHFGNIYFMLMLSFFLLLPLHLANIPKIVRLIRSSKWVIPLLVGFFIFYVLTFINDHGYNQDLHSVFFRNRMLVYTTMEVWHLIVSFFLVAFSLLSMIVTPLHRPVHWLLYPFTVLFLIPSWLIEQRYFLIPFILFLLFRRNQHPVLEWVLAIYSFLFCNVLFTMIADRWFFL